MRILTSEISRPVCAIHTTFLCREKVVDVIPTNRYIGSYINPLAMQRRNLLKSLALLPFAPAAAAAGTTAATSAALPAVKIRKVSAIARSEEHTSELQSRENLV